MPIEDRRGQWKIANKFLKAVQRRSFGLKLIDPPTRIVDQRIQVFQQPDLSSSKVAQRRGAMYPKDAIKPVQRTFLPETEAESVPPTHW